MSAQTPVQQPLNTPQQSATVVSFPQVKAPKSRPARAPRVTLTDLKLQSLRPAVRVQKVSDRDGMHVAVMPGGTKSFRCDYRVNGRRETLVLGHYDDSLAGQPERDLVDLEFGVGMATDLTAVEYGYNLHDQILLERKESMKARGLASPDTADALACTFAAPVPVANLEDDVWVSRADEKAHMDVLNWDPIAKMR